MSVAGGALFAWFVLAVGVGMGIGAVLALLRAIARRDACTAALALGVFALLWSIVGLIVALALRGQ